MNKNLNVNINEHEHEQEQHAKEKLVTVNQNSHHFISLPVVKTTYFHVFHTYMNIYLNIFLSDVNSINMRLMLMILS